MRFDRCSVLAKRLECYGSMELRLNSIRGRCVFEMKYTEMLTHFGVSHVLLTTQVSVNMLGMWIMLKSCGGLTENGD